MILGTIFSPLDQIQTCLAARSTLTLSRFGELAIITIDELAFFLADNGANVEYLSKSESFAVHKLWSNTFGRFAKDTPCKQGSKAVNKFLSFEPGQFFILFLSERDNAFPVSSNARPCLVLEFDGHPIDVSQFCELEFAVFPKDFGWTLVHTHEDWAMGGPYFVIASDVKS